MQSYHNETQNDSPSDHKLSTCDLTHKMTSETQNDHKLMHINSKKIQNNGKMM